MTRKIVDPKLDRLLKMFKRVEEEEPWGIREVKNFYEQSRLISLDILNLVRLIEENKKIIVSYDQKYMKKMPEPEKPLGFYPGPMLFPSGEILQFGLDWGISEASIIEQELTKWEQKQALVMQLISSPNFFTDIPGAYPRIYDMPHILHPLEKKFVRDLNKHFPLHKIARKIWKILYPHQDKGYRSLKWTLGNTEEDNFGRATWKDRIPGSCFGRFDRKIRRIYISACLVHKLPRSEDESYMGALDPFWTLVHELIHAAGLIDHGVDFIHEMARAKDILWEEMCK